MLVMRFGVCDESARMAFSKKADWMRILPAFVRVDVSYRLREGEISLTQPVTGEKCRVSAGCG